MIVAKTQIMTVGNWSTSAKTTVGSDVWQAFCEEFCFLGSTIRQEGYEREALIRLGKANAVFGRLGRMWACNMISLLVKVRLYESLVLSVQYYMGQKHGR